MYSGPTLFPLLAAPFVGSFLATLALRLPRCIPVVRGRSHCPACGATLSPRSLVPIFSWLVQRARCRHCHSRISAYYPAVEIAALAIAVWSFATVPGLLVPVSSMLGWALLTLAIIDFRHGLLPDIITGPLTLAGIATAWTIDPDSAMPHSIAAIGGLTAAWLLATGYRRIRGRVGLGTGDVKFIAAAGAWVGLAGLPSVIFLAALGGLLFAITRGLLHRTLAADTRIPFGPFLGAGLWITWLYGPITFGGILQ